VQRDRLELDAKGASGAQAEAIRAKAEDYGKKVARYDQEKADIQAKASNLEKERDDAMKHGAAFGVAVIYLQIAILLSSIAALLKKQPVWWLGLAIGAVGVVHFANGFLLFF